MLTVVASAARTAAGNSGSLKSSLPHPELIRRLRLVLDVTVAATETGDLLDVWFQTTYDGTTFNDVARFVQVLGDGGAKAHIMEWYGDVTPEDEASVPQDAAMSAGVTQGGKLGVDCRVKWTVTDAGTDNASFTFSVAVDPLYR